ncbi:MAG: PorT family protein [Treponema sp.]|nr:PorT family protein [Treponema sp.]
MEIAAANYGMVYTPEEADYTMQLNVTEEEDPEVEGGISSVLTISVIRNKDNYKVVEFAWGYVNLEEMYQWNLYLVYNALANVSLSKLEEAKAPEPVVPVDPSASWREKWLYLGFRAGPSFTGYSFQSTRNYASGLSPGISGEGGLVADIRILRFFSIQTEMIITFDTFNVAKDPDENNGERSTDSFSAISFTAPLMVKVPLGFEKFLLSFYTGAYLALTPFQINRKSSNSDDNYDMNLVPPLGFVIGMDLGLRLGPGELFMDLRYTRDFGMTIVRNGNEPQYIRDRITMGLGYKFGLIRRGKPENTKNEAPDSQTGTPPAL